MLKLDNGCLRVNLRVINSQSSIIYCLRELLRKYLNFPVVLQRFLLPKNRILNCFHAFLFCFRAKLLRLLRLAIVRFAGQFVAGNCVAHSPPHCCYYLSLAFGQFTYWLTPHTYIHRKTSADRISLSNVFNKFYALVNLTSVFPPNLNPFIKQCVCVPPCLSQL